MRQIDCKAIKKSILDSQKEIIAKNNLKPSLLIIVSNNDKASLKYVNNKMKACEEVGINVELFHLNNDCSEEDIISIIHNSNHDSIILQQPLPKHLNVESITNHIPSLKDCDGSNFVNMGLLVKQQGGNVPATPKGIMKMLLHEKIDLSGKNVLIIGRSLLVGTPLSILMTNFDATVTLAHSKTKDLEKKVSSGEYDIIVSAIGKAKAIKKAKASILIDVGINFDENNKMCGDIDIETCECELYTPVPNGVGQLTVASIIENITMSCIARMAVEYEQ